jgi:environmental stress-induced protein Ves
MSVWIISRENQITDSWSGGTTTQLAIYPENSSYQQRNFLYRISTATVDIE